MLYHEAQTYNFPARLADSVRKNRVSIAEGQIIKQRRWWGKCFIYAGNLFLSVTSSPVFMFASDTEWQCWELHSYQLLYGIEGQAISSSAIQIPPLPGRTLRAHIAANTLTPMMIAAAAHELRRAHGLFSPLSGRHWTHGDLHTGNVLYHERTGCAYLIDFDTQHQPELTGTACRADDLLVFLLELIGTCADWVDLSELFLRAYADQAVLEHLAHRLQAQAGLEWLLWKIRANYLPLPLLVIRIRQLRHLLACILSD